MNLSTLRRLVIAGNVLALGAAAWASHGVLWDPPAMPQRDWAALFPARPAGSAELATATKDPLDEYRAALRWPQGEKPKPVEPTKVDAGPPPPPPLAQRYVLRTVWEGPTLFESWAQLGRNGAASEMAFSVRVGSLLIDAEPGDPNPPPGEWRLDNVSLRPDGRMTATFRSEKSGERVTLEGTGNVPGAGADLRGAAGPGGAVGGPALRAAGGVDGPPVRPKVRLVSSDDARGRREYELPAEDREWFGANLDDEVKKIATQPGKGPDGSPQGVVLKAVPASSRLSELGFQAEDRVISVNDEAVNSIDHAIEVGKRQYDAGKGTFIIRVDRGGKILNYTYRAPPKKQ